MKFELLRTAKEKDYTIGNLSVGDLFLCNTLEPTMRELIDKNGDGDFDEQGEGKIYGMTAIPEDTYKIVLAYAPHFGRELPLLLNVKGFTGILIHNGCYPKHTKGCILVGENTAPGFLNNSRHYSDVITLMVREALKKGEEVTITIKSK